jgi:hypothetical protein
VSVNSGQVTVNNGLVLCRWLSSWR